MQELNTSLFLLVNGPTSPNAFLLALAKVLANQMVWLLPLAVPVAWARIYLGVHFPLDMVGALLVAVLSAYLCFNRERWLQDVVCLRVGIICRYLFALPISRGWVRL
jgi:undecaprenyl-diphosphatase